MKRKHFFLIALIIGTFIYGTYLLAQLRQGITELHVVPDKYTHSTQGADLTVLDFNKHGCDVCRNLHPVLKEAMKRDGRIKYIPRTVTSGSEWEKLRVTAVYAAAEQGKFIEMYNAIYDQWPIDSNEKLFSVAQSIGLDTERLERDMSNSDIIAQANHNNAAFEAWGFSRTPTLFLSLIHI